MKGKPWQQLEGRLESGDRNTAGYNPLREKYYVITRIPDRGLRTCGLWESDNGQDFEYVKEIAAPDKKDPEETEFYGMITFPYAGMQMGFLEMYYVPIRKLDTQLMYSGDGLDWYRVCKRQTFLQCGPPGSWDHTWVTPSHNPPIQVGDQLYIFYQGRKTLHWAEKPFGHIGSIGLGILRVDGFVSLDSIWQEGSVITTPLFLEGKLLHINADARPGTVRVEVLDSNGKPLPGFSRNDCEPMSMLDSTDYTMKWTSGHSLKELADKHIKLRFYIQGAKLYSFWME